MQPARRSGRRIQQSPRPERALEYERLSDPILVKRARDGDPQALDALCRRHAPKVEALARRVLRNPDDAADAAQEALAKLCVRIRQFRGESQFSTWLHRLVLNTCSDAATRRAARATEPLEADLRPARDGDPARAAALGELRRELCSSLGEIAPDQARVVVLKDALGFSFEEISAASGMPVGTAKCYAHRGRSRLRDRLDDVERRLA